MEDKKSKNKKVIIIVVAIIAVIAVIIAGVFVNDRAQRGIINEEIDTINKTGNVDTNIKTSGKYADVEKALKDYITEYQSVAEELENEYKSDKIQEILSADNYKKDGPEFKESKKIISDIKAKGEETKTKLTEMVTKEAKEKKANESGLTGKYKELFIESIKLEQEAEKFNKTVDNINDYFEKAEEIFDFLNKNKNKWTVKNNTVQFNDYSLLIKYNSLVTSINIAGQKLSF